MNTKKSDRMYHFSKEQKNPQVGCEFGCTYCAFKMLTHRLSKCPDCKSFKPHYHLERFKKTPKKTSRNEFISLCLNGDVSFASAEFFKILIKYCEQWHDRTFLVQSKNPARVLSFDFPYNVIIGTTIETDLIGIGRNNVLYSTISRAPHPEERYRAIRQVTKNDVHVTIEPIMDFHPDELESWMRNIPRLKVINIGYDSRPELNRLPEPSLEKVNELITRLEKIAEVRTKLIRPAWWEPEYTRKI